GGDSATISIAENTMAVTTVTATAANTANLIYSLSGTDAALFDLDATTGVLTFTSAPNFEAPADTGTNNVYDVIVTASDGLLTDSQTLAITVTNVNEAPVITSNGGGTAAAISIAENTASVTTVVAADPDGTAPVYSLSGTDAQWFSINALTGALAFRSAPNFEAPRDAGADNVYDVIVTASDGALADDQALAITVTNVDEAPVITSNGGGASTQLRIAENISSVLTVVAVDPEGAPITYSINGTDASRFTIDPVTGALAFIAAPDYEAPTDAGFNNVYNLNLVASDGLLTDTQALAVTVVNVSGIKATLRFPGALDGTGEADTLTGSSGEDTISGLDGNDILRGAGGNDTILGGTGNDTITGGAGADWLSGDAGADVFNFDAIAHSRVGLGHDTIMDFNSAEGDRIDLVGIDANTGRGGNQAFALLVTDGAAFTGPAQLRYHFDGTNTIIQGNVNGNLAPDFEIILVGNVPVTSDMFVL
ncbi:MAG: cadherin, partial [Novosphingobium sp.]